MAQKFFEKAPARFKTFKRRAAYLLTGDMPLYKVLLVGNTEVGKYGVYNGLIKNKTIHDTAGEERPDYSEEAIHVIDAKGRDAGFRATYISAKKTSKTAHRLRERSRDDADGYIMCFDLKKRETFHQLSRHEHFLQEGQDVARKPIAVVGCKGDYMSEVLEDTIGQFVLALIDRGWTVQYFRTNAANMDHFPADEIIKFLISAVQQVHKGHVRPISPLPPAAAPGSSGASYYAQGGFTTPQR